MKLTEKDIKQNKKPGDTAWACNGRTASIPPYRVTLACQKAPNKDNTFDDSGTAPLWFAIPILPDGSLNWKRVRRLDTRYYAETESECRELYKEQLKEQMEYLEKRKRKIQKELERNVDL